MNDAGFSALIYILATIGAFRSILWVFRSVSKRVSKRFERLVYDKTANLRSWMHNMQADIAKQKYDLAALERRLVVVENAKAKR